MPATRGRPLIIFGLTLALVFTVVLGSNEAYGATCTVTFKVQGVSSDAVGVMLTVDSSTFDYTQLQLGVAFTWNVNSTHTYSYSDPIGGSAGTRYAWSWTSGYGQTAKSGTLTASQDGNVTAGYKTQYQVAFALSGVGSDFGGNVVTIDDIGYLAGDLPKFLWWDSLSSHIFSFQSSLTVNSGKQYVWTGTSGLSSSQSGSIITFGSGAATGIYKTQYYLKINAPSYTSVNGDGWYDGGATARFSVNSPVSGGTGERYVFVKWTGDYTGTSPSASTTMDGSKTLTASYKSQYYLTVTGASSVKGGGWYDQGSTATPTSPYVWNVVTNQTRSNLMSFSLDGASTPVGRRGSGVFKTPGISMSAPHTVAFVDMTQYYLAVNGGVNVTFSIPSPTGDQWYDDGTSVTVSSSIFGYLRADTRLRITSVTFDGRFTPITQTSGVYRTLIDMTTFHVLRFGQLAQYLFAVYGGNNATPNPASETHDGWYDEGIILTVSSDYTWSAIPEQSRTNLLSLTLNDVSIPINRNGRGIFTSSPINMSAPRIVHLISVTQYYLSVTGGYNATVSKPSPTLDNWYDMGTSLEVSANHVWNQTGQSRYSLISWTIDNVIYPILTRQNSSRFTTSTVIMSTYHGVVFNPIVQYQLLVQGGSQITYTILSPTRDNWYDVDTELSVSTAYVWNSTDNRRLSLFAWSKDGGARINVTRQGEGAFPTPNFAMTQAHTIVFTDVTQFYLLLQANVTSAPHAVNGSQTADRWFDSGSAATFGIETLALATTNGSRYFFVGWVGYGEASYTGSDISHRIAMTSPVVETSLWKTQHLVTFSFTDFYGEKGLLSSSIGITDSLGRTYILRNHSYFADRYSSWKVSSVVWEGVDVGPKGGDTVSYLVTDPSLCIVRLDAYSAEVIIRDPLGLSVAGAIVNATLANSTSAAVTASSDGIASLGYIPFGTFNGYVNFLGDLVPVSAESVGKNVIQTRVTFSYPVLAIIVSVEVAVGAVFYVLSPSIFRFLSTLQKRISRISTTFRR